MDPFELDQNVVGRYLASSIKGFGRLADIKKFPDGQSNPTFLLTTNSGQYVLRRQPPGELLKSAHAVDREFRVMQALQQTPIPVPKVFHLCEDREVIGSLFFVMEFIDGTVFFDPALPTHSPQQRNGIYNEMNRILAALHNLDVDDLGLSDYGKPGNYFTRQVDRWTRQYRASETDVIADMDALIEWLPRNLPKDDHRVSLIHGDYRIDNLVFKRNSSQAGALLDWELSTLGHPFADLAYQCMQWRMDKDGAIRGLGGVDRVKLGIPSEEQYLERYCLNSGIGRIDHWNFYLVFSFFRFASILQGVLKRAMNGNASSDRAFEYGRLTPQLAKMATQILEIS